MNIIDPRLESALRLAGNEIRRRLSEAFGQLDAATGSVETRKLFHALLVREAILTSHQRFPDNAALIEALEAALAIIRGKPSIIEQQCPA